MTIDDAIKAMNLPETSGERVQRNLDYINQELGNCMKETDKLTPEEAGEYAKELDKVSRVARSISIAYSAKAEEQEE